MRKKNLFKKKFIKKKWKKLKKIGKNFSPRRGGGSYRNLKVQSVPEVAAIVLLSTIFSSSWGGTFPVFPLAAPMASYL